MPAVSPEISTAWRIGTPELTAPEKVRAQRAKATFWTTSPIFAGRRSLKRSQSRRPLSVRFQRTNTYAAPIRIGIRMYQAPVTASEAVTVICVGSGSGASAPVLLRDLLEDADEHRDDEGDDGDHHQQRDEKTIAGYIIADWTWRLSASSFSSWIATRSSDCSSRPAPSPAATIERYKGREDPGLAVHRRVQRAAGLDVVAQRGDRRLEHRILGLVLERVERAQHRHARGDQRRELAREDGELAHVDVLEPLEDALELERLVALGDVEDDQAALAQLIGDLRLRGGLELARGREPRRGRPLGR